MEKERDLEKWNFESHPLLAAWKGKEIYAIVPGTLSSVSKIQSHDLSFRELRGGGTR